MEIQIYAVYDIKADAHMQPFFTQNEGIARRAFSNSATDPAGSIGRNPEDYYLVLLGTFDDHTGVIQPTIRKIVMNGLDAVASQLKEKTNNG